MNPEETRAEKARLRERFRRARLALSDADYAALGARIRERLLALPEIAAARTVHVYWPLVERREVDTRPLIAALHQRGVRVVLPVVVHEAGVPTLRHCLFEGEDRLCANRWGLLEPAADAPEADPADLDAVVVPAFGAGRDGHRIGHGAGYYDAFLARLDAFAVCPAYDACLVDRVPAEPHDRPVDAVVTETETWRVDAVR